MCAPPGPCTHSPWLPTGDGGEGPRCWEHPSPSRAWSETSPPGAGISLSFQLDPMTQGGRKEGAGLSLLPQHLLFNPVLPGDFISAPLCSQPGLHHHLPLGCRGSRLPTWPLAQGCPASSSHLASGRIGQWGWDASSRHWDMSCPRKRPGDEQQLSSTCPGSGQPCGPCSQHLDHSTASPGHRQPLSSAWHRAPGTPDITVTWSPQVTAQLPWGKPVASGASLDLAAQGTAA